MGRKPKIYPGQVEDVLKENDEAITIREIAKILETTQTTIRKKIRQLRKEGKSIIPTRKGVMLKEKVKNVDDAKQIMESSKWLMGILISLAGIAVFTKVLLLQSQKYLTSKEDRKEMRHMAILLRQTIDLIETEEEFLPHQLEMSQ